MPEVTPSREVTGTSPDFLAAVRRALAGNIPEAGKGPDTSRSVDMSNSPGLLRAALERAGQRGTGSPAETAPAATETLSPLAETISTAQEAARVLAGATPADLEIAQAALNSAQGDTQENFLLILADQIQRFAARPETYAVASILFAVLLLTACSAPTVEMMTPTPRFSDPTPTVSAVVIPDSESNAMVEPPIGAVEPTPEATVPETTAGDAGESRPAVFKVPPTPETPEETLPVVPEVQAAAATYTVETTLNGRNAPSTTDSEVITSIPAGTELQVIGKDATSDWLYVDLDGQQLWVSVNFGILSGTPLDQVPVYRPDGTPLGGVGGATTETGTSIENTTESLEEGVVLENIDAQNQLEAVAEYLQMGPIVETSELHVGDVNLRFAVTASLIDQLKEKNSFTEGQPIWVIRESKKATVASVVHDLIIHAYESKHNLQPGSVQELASILGETIPVKVRLAVQDKIVYEVKDIPIATLVNAGVIFGEPQFGTGQIGFTDAYLDQVTYLFDEETESFTFVLNPTTFTDLSVTIDQELTAANDSMKLTESVYITEQSGTRLVTLDELLFALKQETINRPMSTSFVYSLIVLSSNGAQEGKYGVGSDDTVTFVNLVPSTLASTFLYKLGMMNGNEYIAMSLQQGFQFIFNEVPTQITQNQE